jgi:hypothetical protein
LNLASHSRGYGSRLAASLAVATLSRVSKAAVPACRMLWMVENLSLQLGVVFVASSCDLLASGYCRGVLVWVGVLGDNMNLGGPSLHAVEGGGQLFVLCLLCYLSGWYAL